MEEERDRSHRRTAVSVLMIVATVAVFASWVVYTRIHNRAATAPAASLCMAWVFDLEAAQVGDYSPVPITPASRPMGTALFCNGTRPEVEATVRIRQGEQTTEVKIKLQSSVELKATGGVVPIGVLEPGLWELEYVVGGQQVARTWVRVDG